VLLLYIYIHGIDPNGEERKDEKNKKKKGRKNGIESPDGASPFALAPSRVSCVEPVFHRILFVPFCSML
jgi:hypothetical protein